MNRMLDEINFGEELRNRINTGAILPLIGVYDVFSAALAARKFEAIFCSGYGFAASYYGLPDEGFIAWPDMVSHVERIRAVLPKSHIIVDMDDGYGDPNIAGNMAKRLERVGASAIILEDQRRPKKCGHLPGKEILDIDDYMTRLERVLKVRDSLFVIARTDAVDKDEAIKRAEIYTQAGADAILVEGIKNIEVIREIRETVGPDKAITVNLIAGGKTDPITLQELQKIGVNLVNYSTPCLFAAHEAINKALNDLKDRDGKLLLEENSIDLTTNNNLLKELLADALS